MVVPSIDRDLARSSNKRISLIRLRSLQLSIKLSELQQQNQTFEEQIVKQHKQLKQTEEQLAIRTADAQEKERLLAEIDSELAKKRATKSNRQNLIIKPITKPTRTPLTTMETQTRAILIDLLLEQRLGSLVAM